ncbi:hypothetical protein [Lacticaseibacillus sharpeae]|jgi:hypothetical protein|uniref:hypothetical protein n=1 Tax=Lacticaseibacillus sharpeae TaxID=1626 RepID=UPI0006D19AFE|nr:hypothetical protein [Lacticaseibacillus sharpeae]
MELWNEYRILSGYKTLATISAPNPQIALNAYYATRATIKRVTELLADDAHYTVAQHKITGVHWFNLTFGKDVYVAREWLNF